MACPVIARANHLPGARTPNRCICDVTSFALHCRDLAHCHMVSLALLLRMPYLNPPKKAMYPVPNLDRTYLTLPMKNVYNITSVLKYYYVIGCVQLQKRAVMPWLCPWFALELQPPPAGRARSKAGHILGEQPRITTRTAPAPHALPVGAVRGVGDYAVLKPVVHAVVPRSASSFLV